MEINFHKYQGAGNDFVLIDNRKPVIRKDDEESIKLLCDRKFGIGADGLMLLQDMEGYDFEMVYFNSDGREGTMCGNGGRCIVAFAYSLGIVGNETRFWAIDGEHVAKVIEPEHINLKMMDVDSVEINPDHYFLNTGSPHYVSFVKDINSLDVFNAGRAVRYNERFKEEGTNVNFVEEVNDKLLVRTYERGVEDETLACGTGITAAAIAAAINNGKVKEVYEIKALGGDLKVCFEQENNSYRNIWLEGPANHVFDGTFKL